MDYYLPFKNLPATLKANDGSITKTDMKNNLLSTILNTEVLCPTGPGPGEVRIMRIPIVPKAIEAQMKMRVAIFCIVELYTILAPETGFEAYSFSTVFAWCSLRSAPYAQTFRILSASAAGHSLPVANEKAPFWALFILLRRQDSNL